MSSSLPPEILDLILDHLYDEPTTLRACCLVSKSWVPRTRRHLFDRVDFHPPIILLESWMKTFPDPFKSPACYSRSLNFCHLRFPDDTAFLDACPWVRSFNQIVNLEVTTFQWRFPFPQLCGLSPALKSLTLTLPVATLSEFLDLICSFPLLEDLSMLSPRFHAEGTDELDTPPTSPKFTGSLFLSDGDSNLMRGLMLLPGGLRFSKVSVSYDFENGDWVKELVSACSNTLESLCVEYEDEDTDEDSEPPLFDLSKATKLDSVEFRMRDLGVGWINETLRTATPKNLRQITICFRDNIFLNRLQIYFPPVGETAVHLGWEELDHLLVHLWTTRSVRPVVTYTDEQRWPGLRPTAQRFLPELTSMGVVGLA